MKFGVKFWRALAVFFIITTVILGGVLFWLMGVGSDYIDSESECAYNICADNYEAFYYDIYTDVCYCYISGEVAHSEYMGSS